jgi:16S rRNA (uracil1498-N3)-methyltransferase
MHTPRFYVPVPLAAGDSCPLPESVAHHALRVLRLRVGDAIQVFNGSGVQHSANIEHVQGGACSVRLAEAEYPKVESELEITLGQGLSQSDKFDWVLQKAVELGVKRIVPLQMKRSIVRLDQERALKKRAHWQGVVVGAAEQSGRVTVPEVQDLKNMEEWIATLPPEALRVRLAPENKSSFASLRLPPQGVILVVGPEGGFDPMEIQQLEAANFISVSLGPRILRTETAALAAIASLQSWFGDFRSTSL